MTTIITSMVLIIVIITNMFLLPLWPALCEVLMFYVDECLHAPRQDIPVTETPIIPTNSGHGNAT